MFLRTLNNLRVKIKLLAILHIVELNVSRLVNELNQAGFMASDLTHEFSTLCQDYTEQVMQI